MKWIEESHRLALKDYKFFEVSIREYNNKYSVNYGAYDIDNLKDAKKKAELLLYKSFKKLNLDKIKTFGELQDLSFVNISHTLWCNNNGNGKYHPKGNEKLWKQYQWIEGARNVTSSISKSYALRYDVHVPVKYVKWHAKIIVKRHIKRFIREFELENM